MGKKVRKPRFPFTGDSSGGEGSVAPPEPHNERRGAPRSGPASLGCGGNAAPPASRLGGDPPRPPSRSSTGQVGTSFLPPTFQQKRLTWAQAEWAGDPPQQQPRVLPGEVGGYRAGPASRRHHFGHGGPTAGSVPSPSPPHLCVRTPARRNNAGRLRPAPLRPRLPPPGPQPRTGFCPQPPTGTPGRAHRKFARAPERNGEVVASVASGGGTPRCITPGSSGSPGLGDMGSGVRDPPGKESAAGTVPRHENSPRAAARPAGGCPVGRAPWRGRRARGSHLDLEVGQTEGGAEQRAEVRYGRDFPPGAELVQRHRRLGAAGACHAATATAAAAVLLRAHLPRPPPAACLPACRPLAASLRGRLRAAAARRSGSARPPPGATPLSGRPPAAPRCPLAAARAWGGSAPARGR